MGQMGLMRGMADGGAPHRCFDCCRCFYWAQWGIMWRVQWGVMWRVQWGIMWF